MARVNICVDLAAVVRVVAELARIAVQIFGTHFKYLKSMFRKFLDLHSVIIFLHFDDIY